jgi:pimeloyl-ACP methyl ester carboxylesterase
MLLRFFRTAKDAALRLRGARPFHLRLGPTELLAWRLGPPGGEPWLMLHGLASTALAWHSVLPDLAHDCRVVLPELAELGGTSTPDGGLSVADGVEVAVELIERELGGGPVTVAGNSLGGWTAVRLALARPELVSRLVLVAAAGYRDQDWQRIERLISVQEPGDLEPLLAALFSHPPKGLALGRRGIFEAYTSQSVAGVLGKLGEADTYGDAELAQIEVPTALVWGEDDGLFELEVAERMVAALPHGTLYRLPRCGHALHWERPRAFARAVAEFRRATDERLPASDAA